jgi:serine/threonine-protein kinase
MPADAGLRRRFIQEAQAASALNHPNIITIYDIVSEGGADFMVLEFVAGKTLLDLIPKGGMRVPQVLNYGVQMADALSAAHAAGIIHRDLKPGNVIVTEGGLVKILDFGLAKLTERDPLSRVEGDAETIAPDTLTVAGSILGTVSYMSPEQAQGRKVDPRSDIFSFGVLLYEMATGSRPFLGDSAISTLSSILRDEARPISEIVPGVPAQLQQVIDRCLRKEPRERWQSMREVHAELAALKQESESAARYQGAPVVRRRLSPGLAALVAAGVMAAAAGAWWIVEHRGRAPETSQPPPAGSRPVGPLPPKPAPSVPVHMEPPAPAPPPAAPQRASAALADGLPFRITLADDIPADAQKGTELRFTVTTDVHAEDALVIQQGATARGEIADGGKKKFLVIGGKMTFRLLTADAVDGHSVKIRATPARRAGGEAKHAVEVGGRRRSRGIAATAGTDYMAYIDGDQTVSIRK